MFELKDGDADKFRGFLQACYQEGIPEERFFIGDVFEYESILPTRKLEDRDCIVWEGGAWHVFYVEKGERTSLSIHDSLYLALHDLWRRVTDDLGPWKYFK